VKFRRVPADLSRHRLRGGRKPTNAQVEDVGLNIAIVNPVLRTPYFPSEFAVGGFRRIPQSELPRINIVELGLALGDLGHRVTIYAADTFLESDEVLINDRVTVRGVPTHLRRIFDPAVVAFTPSLAHNVRLREADVIQSGEFYQLATFYASRAAAQTGIPLIVWQESFRHMRIPGLWYEQSFHATLGRAVRANTRSYIPRTQKARAYLQEIAVPTTSILPWIPTGINGADFQPESPTYYPQDFGFPTDFTLALVVARLSPGKGVDIAIRAISLLKKRGIRVGLIIRGIGPEQDSLKSMTKQLDVEDVVRFLGLVPRAELAKLYNSSDLLLVPSRNDLLPFALLEAGSCGLPSVTADAGCMSDFVQDGITGALVAPDSSDAMASAIDRLVADPDLRESMGRAARQRVAESFDLRVVASRLSKVYEETVLDAPGPHGDL
jgi:glycosyltransferase involved in cell wall biosynthesis